EIARRRAATPRAELERRVAQAGPARDFEGALAGRPGRARLIAEVKKASPSRGVLAGDLDPLALARSYAAAGADAISVLTADGYFQRSRDLLAPKRSAPGGMPGRHAGPPLIAERARKRAETLLLRSAARGTEGEPRQPIEWTAARDLTGHRWRVVLSAGLTPENVGRAVATARPYAVDVNSGVETQPGRKDPDKVWRFVAAAKGVRCGSRH